MAFDGKQIRNATIVGAKLANLTITSGLVANDAIITAKILDAAVEESKLADGSVSEAKLAASAVTVGKLADGAVTTAKLFQTAGTEAVTTETIRTSAVTTAKIADSAVTLAKLAANAVDGTKIADGSVSLGKLAADSVDSSKIVDGSITGADIANNTVAPTNLVTAYETTLLFRDGSRAMSGSLDLGTGNRITNLANPEQAQDAATKSYVDAVVTSLDLKASVRAATTANIALDNTTTEVDGVTLANDDRVLVKNQTTASQNGLWVVSTSGAWTRAIDANTSPEVTSGLFSFVEEGDENANTGWVLTTSGTISVGGTELEFTQFSGAGSYLPGVGLILEGTQFSVAFNDADDLGYDTDVWDDAIADATLPGKAGESNFVARADHSHSLNETAIEEIIDTVDGRFLRLDGGNVDSDIDLGWRAADAGAEPPTEEVQGYRIVALANPVNARDAATKAYVDLGVAVLATPDTASDNDTSAGGTPGAVSGHALLKLEAAPFGYEGKALSDVDLNIHKIVNLVDPIASQDAATKAYVDGQIVSAGGGNDTSGKNMVAEVTAADGDLACDIAMGFPAKGYVQVFVNGIKANVLGSKLGDCYFSNDAGVSFRALDFVRDNDKLYWNGSIAGYELAISDRIDFDYVADPSPG